MAISKSVKVNVAKYIASISFEEFEKSILNSDYSKIPMKFKQDYKKEAVHIYKRIAALMGIIENKNVSKILLEKRLIKDIIQPSYDLREIEEKNIEELLKSEIDEILVNTKSGLKGHLISAFKYRLFKDDVEEGIELLKKKDAESLVDLIDADIDLRTAIFVSASMVEGFTNTLVMSSEVSKMMPKGDFKGLIINGDKSDWIKSLSNKKSLGKHFNKFTLGKKVLFLSRLNESLFRNLLGSQRSKKYSKSMIINSLKIWVDIRNDAAHDGFIAIPTLFNKLPYNPPKESSLTKSRHILQKLDIIMAVIGHRGKFTKSFKDVVKKYSESLKLNIILK